MCFLERIRIQEKERERENGNKIHRRVFTLHTKKLPYLRRRASRRQTHLSRSASQLSLFSATQKRETPLRRKELHDEALTDNVLCLEITAKYLRGVLLNRQKLKKSLTGKLPQSLTSVIFEHLDSEIKNANSELRRVCQNFLKNE